MERQAGYEAAGRSVRADGVCRLPSLRLHLPGCTVQVQAGHAGAGAGAGWSPIQQAGCVASVIMGWLIERRGHGRSHGLRMWCTGGIGRRRPLQATLALRRL
jgi:hypothetical protein